MGIVIYFGIVLVREFLSFRVLPIRLKFCIIFSAAQKKSIFECLHSTDGLCWLQTPELICFKREQITWSDFILVTHTEISVDFELPQVLPQTWLKLLSETKTGTPLQSIGNSPVNTLPL